MVKLFFKLVAAFFLATGVVHANWSASGNAGTYEVQVQSVGVVASGTNRWVATLKRDGQPINDATVTLRIWMPAMPPTMPYMESKGTLDAKGDGRYEGALAVIHPGTWRVNVVIDHEDKTSEFRSSLRF